jgi:hypothetical protein
MLRKFSRWIRSKAGLASIAGLVVVLLLVGIVGQQLKWWDLNLTGTAGFSLGEYPAPQGGYTCLPTCLDDDGKFLVISNPDQATSDSEKLVVWIGVPGNKTSFELNIFDGDTGKDDSGKINAWKGNWDDGTLESTYRLYADPLKDGKGNTLLKTWLGNTDNLPDNAWFTQTINNVDSAKAPSQHYFYRLEITQTTVGKGNNAFKLRSNSYLLAGQTDLSQYCFPPVLRDQATNPMCSPKASGGSGAPQFSAADQQNVLAASQEAAGIATYNIITGLISNGQEVRGNFVIESAGALQVNHVWETGDLNLGLTDPNSHAISKVDPNVQYQRIMNEFGTGMLYSFSSAPAGTWAFIVTGNNLMQPTPYRIYIHSGDPITPQKTYLPLIQKSTSITKPYP